MAEEEDEEELRFNDDGIPIEPFNMKAEQWSGYFDADGNYLAYRNQDDTDAWLETLPSMYCLPRQTSSEHKLDAAFMNLERSQGVNSLFFQLSDWFSFSIPESIHVS